MGKGKKSLVMSRLQSSARLSRTALAARLNGHGFYAGQDQIMLALSHEDGQTPGQLAARLGVRPPTITKTINRLAAQGVLEKTPSKEDARQAHISLTDQGKEAIQSIEKSVRKVDRQAFRGFDKKDKKQLAKFLGRIEANLAGAIPDDADEELELED